MKKAAVVASIFYSSLLLVYLLTRWTQSRELFVFCICSGRVFMERCFCLYKTRGSLPQSRRDSSSGRTFTGGCADAAASSREIQAFLESQTLTRQRVQLWNVAYPSYQAPIQSIFVSQSMTKPISVLFWAVFIRLGRCFGFSSKWLWQDTTAHCSLPQGGGARLMSLLKPKGSFITNWFNWQ